MPTLQVCYGLFARRWYLGMIQELGENCPLSTYQILQGGNIGYRIIPNRSIGCLDKSP